jgi:hypothetical protein
MTLNDIGRMIKLAKVPRSKVIQTTYPNPAFVILVPMTHYFVIANVVGQLQLRTDNVTVKPLTDERDVRTNEHVYVKVTGHGDTEHKRMKDETRSMYAHRRTAFNRNVVVECVSVVL